MSYIGKHCKSTQKERDALDAIQDALSNDEGVNNHDDAELRAKLDDDTRNLYFDSDSDPDDLDDLDDLDDADDLDLDGHYNVRWWEVILIVLMVLLVIPVLIVTLILWLLALLCDKLFHWKLARRFLSLFESSSSSDIPDGTVDSSELSKEKRLVPETFDDEEVRIMPSMMQEHQEKDNAQTHDSNTDPSDEFHLDATTMAKVEAFRVQESKLDLREAHWLASVESLLRCKVQKPQGFDGLTAQQIYRKLYDFLTAHFLPEAFIRRIVPELVYYVVNGKLKRPLLLVGAPGCGKTTSIKIISEALDMVSCHYDAVTRETLHSLFGKSSSFPNPDCGDLATGIICTGTLNPIFQIDVPNQTSSPTTRAAFQEEALSLCDESHETFTDAFLGFPLPLKGTIICFTANTTDTITQPLLDHCDVIRFDDIEESRVQDIIAHYAETECESLLYKDTLELDHAALRNAVAALYSQGVHSIRQHQKLVDRAFCDAFSVYVFNESDHPESVVVDETLYAEAMTSGDFITAKKADF